MLNEDQIDAKNNLMDEVDAAVEEDLLDGLACRHLKSVIARGYAASNGSPDKIQDMCLTNIDLMHLSIPTHLTVKRIEKQTTESNMMLKRIVEKKPATVTTEKGMWWITAFWERNKESIIVVFVLVAFSERLFTLARELIGLIR